MFSFPGPSPSGSWLQHEAVTTALIPVGADGFCPALGSGAPTLQMDTPDQKDGASTNWNLSSWSTFSGERAQFKATHVPCVGPSTGQAACSTSDVHLDVHAVLCRAGLSLGTTKWALMRVPCPGGFIPAPPLWTHYPPGFYVCKQSFPHTWQGHLYCEG